MFRGVKDGDAHLTFGGLETHRLDVPHGPLYEDDHDDLLSPEQPTPEALRALGPSPDSLALVVPDRGYGVCDGSGGVSLCTSPGGAWGGVPEGTSSANGTSCGLEGPGSSLLGRAPSSIPAVLGGTSLGSGAAPGATGRAVSALVDTSVRAPRPSVPTRLSPVSTWMRLGSLAAAAPSMVTSRTPLSYRARTLSSSTPSGRVMLRRNEPCLRSLT